MKLSHLLLALPLLSLTTTTNATTYPDQVGACYIFKGNKVVKRDVCLISSSSSTGVSYNGLTFNSKTYKILDSSGWAGDDDYTVDGLKAKRYIRETNFYKVISLDDTGNEPYLLCFKTKAVDICYK